MTTKRSEEIAIEIKQHERLYDDHIEEAKRIIKLQEKEYIRIIEQAKTQENKGKKTKTQYILSAGKMLERYKVVPRDRISGKLQRDFKGYIDGRQIRNVIRENGLEWTYKPKGHSQKVTKTASIASLTSETHADLTPTEKQYVEAVERELITDKTIQRLIFEWTNKNTAEQGQVLDRTPKGKHWSNVLAEESTDFMRQLAYQMTISALGRRLEDIRIIKNIADKFGDILYEVYETRKKTEPLESA